MTFFAHEKYIYDEDLEKEDNYEPIRYDKHQDVVVTGEEERIINWKLIFLISMCCPKIVQEERWIELYNFSALACSLIKNCEFVQLGALLYILWKRYVF